MSHGTVEFYILGRRFELACDAGQEGRLSSLAQDLRRRLDELYAAHPAARTLQSEMQLLVMAALGYADLWQDTEAQRRQMAAQLERQHSMNARVSGSNASSHQASPQASEIDESALAEKLESWAEELESYATALEKLLEMP